MKKHIGILGIFKMNKKGIIWGETKDIILIVIALIAIILLIYFFKDRVKEYVGAILDLLRI